METKLIESALALTGKTMEDMQEIIYTLIIDCLPWNTQVYEFSIEKFCYYLLGPEFIENYWNNYWDDVEWIAYPEDYYPVFWIAIWAFQKWDEKPLIELLSNIWKSNT